MATIRDFAAPVAGAARLSYDQALDTDVRAIVAGGIVQADSFPGASDSAKMSAAMTYAAAQTYRPWIQLPARSFDTGTTSFDMYNGMKICGPGVPSAPKNPEAAGGAANQVGVWRTSCGTGANSLLRSSTTVQSVAVTNVSFFAPGNASQIFRSSGGNGCYPSVFHNLNMYGGPYFFGNPSEKFLTTQMVFSGHWQFAVNIDTPFTLGGGDCSLWMSGYANCDGTQGSGAGKPVMEFSGLGKSNIGCIYMTNRTDWTGIRINNSSADKMLSFYGGMYEGQSQSNLSTRPVLEILGGTNNFFGIYTGQVSDASGTVNGVIHQSGGQANFYGGAYYRGGAVSASFPWLYQTGGTARIYGPPVCTYAGEQIRVRWSDGTTQTLAAHANGVVA